MRISTSWAHQQSVNSLLNQQSKVSKTQTQLSTGLKNITPADDPVAAKKVLDFQDTIARLEQYQKNVGATLVKNNLEESVISSSEDVLFRAKELTIQALNGTLSQTDRYAIKQEVDQLIDNLLGLANTQDANGEYIFSGDLSKTPAFAWNAETESYTYQGGDHQRQTEVDQGRQIANGDIGSRVFQEIDSVSKSSPDGLRSIFDTLQGLSDALVGSYDISQATITGDRFLKYGKDYSAAPVSFDLAVDGGGSPVSDTVTIAAGNYQTLDELLTAVNAGISSSALNGTVEARAFGNKIEFISVTEGAESAITISNDAQGVLSDFGFAEGQSNSGVDIGGSIIGRSAFEKNYAANPVQFQLHGDTGITVDISLNTDFSSVTDAIAEINNQIALAGADGAMGAKLAENGTSIEFFSKSSGGASSIQIKNLAGSFLTDAGFDDGQIGHLYNTVLNEIVTDLDAALDSFLHARTGVGARLNALENHQIQHEKSVLDLQTVLSETQDLDYTEAISRFNLENIVLQAAQQSFVKVQNLSLFNFL